jgi:hypothetical protein
MGLLDTYLSGQYSGDKNKNEAIQQGLLSLGLGLLNSKGNFGNALGQAGQQGLATYHRSREENQQAEMRKQAMEQQAQMMADEAKRRAFLQNMPSPQMQASQQALQGGGGPTMANAAQMPPVDPMQQMLHQGAQAGAIPLQAYLASMQKPGPHKLGKDERLLEGGTNRVLVDALPSADKKNETLEALKTIYGEGSPQYLQALQSYGKKLSTHAPAASMVVNTAKPLLNTVAEGLGKQIDSSLEVARTAVNNIGTAQSLRAAVDSGKLVSGPGTTFRVLGLQIGQMLGVGGKDATETLTNTRTAIRGMAQAELDGAAQLKGQGTISESERAMLKRAASGDIDNLTGPEIRQLSEVMEKAGRARIKHHP